MVHTYFNKKSYISLKLTAWFFQVPADTVKLQHCMRAKNLGSGIPSKSIQSSIFSLRKLCILLDIRI